MSFSADEYLGTLGGSLMKDLLADLQVDDGDFSLDQLEKELATLEQDTSQFEQQPLPAFDAAALVVSHAQGQSTSLTEAAQAKPFGNQGMDAWSLSLQNFTALSLQEDFLAADSARKQQQQTVTSNRAPMVMEGAEDYDILEKPNLTPPPGLGGPLKRSAAPQQVPKVPDPKPFPKTPQNSIRNVGDIEEEPEPVRIRPAVSMPSQISVNQILPSSGGIQPQMQPVQPHLFPNQPTMIPEGIPPPPPHGIIAQLSTPMGQVPQGIPTQKMQPQGGMMMPPPMIPPQGAGRPKIVATPAMGPAWQSPHEPVPLPPVRAFCNPHPAAPPIPATVLESEYMNARDIAYVVHSILRPVLAEGVSENDYFIQFLRRLGGPHANPAQPKHTKDINEEMMSRANKAKEWSSEKGVLGHVAKTNVTRPRALIATPQAAHEHDSEQKQRATLWKARIYCDQAYQSYQIVVDIWRSSPPGAVPPQLQPHLVKLMKCMGITHADKEYHLDKDSLSLLAKLNKGRNLISRLLDQALLPPNAVQALLPALLDVLLAFGGKKGEDPKSDDLSIERLFRSIAIVLQKLNTSSDTLLSCLEVVERHGRASLSSTARMECVHTLLQKGSVVVGQDPSEQKRTAWGKAENAFMSLLQAY